ncbi:MAG: ATP synthase F1 subunit delta [Candidatus Pacebacteria bacterium]|jgi:F-type H+-transporting ATPase subunit delta|nr:ATP synthase F1 subunit delta [Candidatus Paceibacterota bacterium]
MKKQSPKLYAEALHELVSGKTAAESIPIIKSFVDMLVKKRMISKSDEVIEVYRQLELKEKGIIEATVSSAQPLAKEAEEKIKELVNKEFGSNEKNSSVQINHKIDEKLLGGAKIQVGDTIIDATLKGRLAILQRELAK